MDVKKAGTCKYRLFCRQANNLYGYTEGPCINFYPMTHPHFPACH